MLTDVDERLRRRIHAYFLVTNFDTFGTKEYNESRSKVVIDALSKVQIP